MLKHVSTVVICLVASSSMAFAEVATMGPTVGTVLVNHGNGFARVGAGSPLAQGDIVSVKKGGRTSIVYAGGCNVKVKPGRTVTIGQTVCDKAGNFQAQARDDGGPLTVLPGPTPGTLVIGGVVVTLAGVGAALALGAKKDTVPFVVGGGGGRGNPPTTTTTPMSP